MKYCERENLFIRFGKSNIVQWSDIENNQDEDEINERIDWSIINASEEINEKLRESQYNFPLENNVEIPLSIRKVCSEIAGIYLYDSRRIIDSENSSDELTAIRSSIEEYFREVNGNKRILNLPKNDNTPFVVQNNEKNDHDHKWFCSPK